MLDQAEINVQRVTRELLFPTLTPAKLYTECVSVLTTNLSHPKVSAWPATLFVVHALVLLNSSAGSVLLMPRKAKMAVVSVFIAMSSTTALRNVKLWFCSPNADLGNTRAALELVSLAIRAV